MSGLEQKLEGELYEPMWSMYGFNACLQWMESSEQEEWWPQDHAGLGEASTA